MTITPQKKLRSGYTTGACAAAATKGALLQLISKENPMEIAHHIDYVEMILPSGDPVSFDIAKSSFINDGIRVGIVKDAGDDPDVTHGAMIEATVSWTGEKGIFLKAGEGVGEVTRLGLGLPIGAPDITRTPRKMIEDAVKDIAASLLDNRGVEVVLSVPGGEGLAKKTELPRLGVVGGIAILGTTGIVHPYSTSAFKASVLLAIRVASKASMKHLVFTTGSQSETIAMKLLSLPDLAFIQTGEFIEQALIESVKMGVKKITLVGFPGKISKIAQGRFRTHSSDSPVDIHFLYEIALSCGVPRDMESILLASNTARYFTEHLRKWPLFFTEICSRAGETCKLLVKGLLEVEVILIDSDGTVLGHPGERR